MKATDRSEPFPNLPDIILIIICAHLFLVRRETVEPACLEGAASIIFQYFYVLQHTWTENANKSSEYYYPNTCSICPWPLFGPLPENGGWLAVLWLSWVYRFAGSGKIFGKINGLLNLQSLLAMNWFLFMKKIVIHIKCPYLRPGPSEGTGHRPCHWKGRGNTAFHRQNRCRHLPEKAGGLPYPIPVKIRPSDRPKSSELAWWRYYSEQEDTPA